MKISQLQITDAKDFSGMVTENNLGAAFAEKPQLVSPLVENIYKLALGDDVISILNEYPTLEINEDTDYEWYLQGAENKKMALQGAYDGSGNALVATDYPGKNGNVFYLKFPEKLFFETHVIVGEKPDLYQLYIKSVSQSGPSFLYEVELFTDDPDLYVDIDDLAAGTEWSVSHSVAPQTLSDRGSDISFTTPFLMRNRISMLRKQHRVPGNMINKGKNSPLAFVFNTSKGTKGTWLNKLDWELMKEIRREKSNLLWYGKSNRRADGTYGNIAYNGYEIKAGMGLRDQIAPANIHYYNTFNLDNLTNFALGLSVGKLPEDSRRFVIGTGEYGLKMVSQAIEAAAGASALEFQRIEGLSGGDKGMYHKPQFVKYATINGIKFEFMHLPHYDDAVRNKIQHPDGGLAESRRLTIMDFGSAGSEPNIQMVRVKGNNETWMYIPGLRDPFSPGGTISDPKKAATSIDGYDIHYADWCGVRVKNPLRLGEWIPNLLA